MIKIIISENEKERRFDRFLKKYLKNMPLSGIYKLLRKDVKINGKREKANYLLKLGDVVTIYMQEERFADLTAAPDKSVTKNRHFKIVYEDDNILAVGKPSGLLTHGDSQEKKNTLTNQVVGYLIDKGEYDLKREKIFTPAPVNRLDRNTTGIVIFGKNSMALRELNANWDSVEKYYLTIVSGIPEKGLLTGRLKKDEQKNKVKVFDLGLFENSFTEPDIFGNQIYAEKVCAISKKASEDSCFKNEKENLDIKSENGESKYIKTFVNPVKVNKSGSASLVEIRLDTGRSHQIRAHLAAAGCPLIGDSKYGEVCIGKRMGISSQMLHAYKVKFKIEGGELEYLNGKRIVLEPPKKFRDIQKKLDCENSETYVSGRY